MGFRLLVLHLTALLSIVESAKFIGCYREKSGIKLMNDGYKEFSGTLTKDICFEFCDIQEASFAGLKLGRECFCSKTRPPYTHLKNNTDCRMKCAGNINETCGGRQLLSVYNLDGRGANKHEDKHLGCYEEYSDEKILQDQLWEFGTMLTPDYCMGQCWRNGYRYAGVQYGTECHCGDEVIDDFRVENSYCSTPCSGDKRQKCGSGESMNVYSTGILDISEENRLMGCYEDEDEVRLLSGLGLTLQFTNTPNKCINLCNSIGYKYAGLHNKIECFCGNRRPPKSLLVDENECSIPCPGDINTQCGGNLRLLVYKSDNTTNEPTSTKRSTTTTTTEPTTTTTTTAAPTTTSASKTTSKPNVSLCKKSVTTVNGKTVCKGTVVFYDEFNKPIDRTRWLHSVLMPWQPDYDFVVFTNKPENSYVKAGRLIIKPNLMEDGYVRRGKLNLKDCTGEPFTLECERQAISYAILPPVESARLNTKESFSFKFGRIDIKAKLPAGDWLYPELYIEPKRRIYGRDYASGRIRIAGARGNKQLKLNGKDIGGGYLESGIILGNPEEVKARSVVRYSSTPWSSGFHNFSFLWSPENMWFMVDGQVKQALIPPEGGKLYELLSFKNGSDAWPQSKVSVAPFDQESFISIGLSVGGIRNFPDNCTSGAYMKPWLNSATKAMANFFQSKDNWINTWTEEDSSLQIDSVKVTAL